VASNSSSSCFCNRSRRLFASTSGVIIGKAAPLR
jgi:hypothetical protein